jgi:hypothetical protein
MLRAIAFVAASVVLVASTGQAELIEVPLPGVCGSYGMATDRTVEFDLGQGLDSVSAVSISWQGSISPGLGHGDGFWVPEDEWFEWSAEFLATMTPDPPQNGFWYSWVTTDDGSFDEVTSFIPHLWPGWDFLLDGAGLIRVELEPDIAFGGVMVSPPSGHIGAATLLLDAEFTPVERTSWSRIKTLFR